MATFEFSMIIDGTYRVKTVEIPDAELQPKNALDISPIWRLIYRQNVINKHMVKWALSHLNLSFKEVNEDES